MKRLLSRRYLADYLALTYAVAYYVWLALRTPGTRMTDIVGDVAFYPLGLVVGIAFWRNSRVPSLDRQTKIAWGCLAASAWSLWLVGNTWPALVSYFGQAAYPWWVGRLEVLQHLFLIAGFLTFPWWRPSPRDRVRVGVDVALILLAGTVLAFHHATRVPLRPNNAAPPDVALVQSVLDWAVFVSASLGVFYKRDATTRFALAFMLGGNILYLAANNVLSGMAVYRLGDPVDGLWFSAWVFRWTAARLAWHRYRRSAAPATFAPGYRSGVFAYVLVAGAFVFLLVQILRGDPRFLGLGAVSAAVMAGLLLFRQVIELRENRRLFEAQLAQEARFRSLVQNASDVVLVVNASGTLSYVSPSADRVLGAGAARVGMPLTDLVPEREAPGLARLFEEGAAGDTRFDTRLVTATGEYREVDIVATDLRNDSAVNGIVLNCRDVTERNELERQLRHAQKLDAVGHLAGGLAHDFNNVLTAIRGYTELLRDQLPAPSEAAEDLGYIEQAVDRAAAVTKKLLAFSRKQAVQRVVLDLNTALRDLEPLLRQLLTDRIEVRLEFDPGLWPVKADLGQMEQVVINLATNARDAMPDGGVLQIVTANRTIADTLPDTGHLPPGDYAALVVIDHGTGMSPEIRARIFEPFYSTKPKERGIGLGLAMVHGIVSHSGGHIAVDSVPGHGTTFTILLPRTFDAAPALASSPAPTEPVAQGRTVLLVDDEFGVRTVARRLLEQAGYAVLEAADGFEALDEASRGDVRIDVLLTDLVMPGLHGRDLIARFRILRPHVPIVCMTGFAGEAQEALSGDGGVSTIVTKPFSADVLLRAIASARPSQAPPPTL